MKKHFLGPGDFYIGQESVFLETLLGSCVSFVFWHQSKKVAGLTHSLLPHRTLVNESNDLSGKFIDESLLIVRNNLFRYGIDLSDMIVFIYGGGDMFPSLQTGPTIGKKNIDQALMIAERYQLDVKHIDTGGCFYRKISIDASSGDVIAIKQPLNFVHRSSRSLVNGFTNQSYGG